MKRKLISILSILIILLPALYAQEVKSPPKEEKKNTPVVRDKFIYNIKGRRDPLMPLVNPEGKMISFASTEEVKDLRLEGIIYSQGKNNYCIINNTVLRIGETLVDYKVLDISKDKVILMKGSETITLTLESESKEGK